MNCHKDVIGQILWCRGCQIVIEECLSNPDELRVSAKQWTANTHKLYMTITQSPAFQRDLEMFFGSNKLLPVQTTIGADLMIIVYKRVIETLVRHVQQRETNESINFNVYEMPAEGLSKVRHVGAWAVRKVVEQTRRYAHDNVYSSNPATHMKAAESYRLCELLEEYVVSDMARLEESSQYPDTLAATEERQFRSRGLTHISDKAFEYFLEAESLRVRFMNQDELRNLKDKFVENTMKLLQNSTDLKEKLFHCFPDHVVNGKQVGM